MLHADAPQITPFPTVFCEFEVFPRTSLFLNMVQKTSYRWRHASLFSEQWEATWVRRSLWVPFKKSMTFQEPKSYNKIELTHDKTLKNVNSNSSPTTIVKSVKTPIAAVSRSKRLIRDILLTDRKDKAPPSHVKWRLWCCKSSYGPNQPDKRKSPHQESSQEAKYVYNLASRRDESSCLWK